MVRGVFIPWQAELMCLTAPRVRPHSARLCQRTETKENASRSNPSSTTALGQRWQSPP